MRHILTIIVFSQLAFGAINTYISTPYIYAVDATSGSVLFERNAEELMYPGSTTKIATALYVLEKEKDLDALVVCSDRRSIQRISPRKKVANHFTDASYLLEHDGVIFGLKYKEEISVRDLLHILLLRSANDAANVLAEHVSGNVETFCEEMNVYLREIGLTHTHFNNPHGLHHPEHVTTPKDMVLLAQHAIKNEVIQQIVSLQSYTIAQTNKHTSRDIQQTNKLLVDGPFYYPEAYGLKTGNHSRAGKCLLACAKNGERDVIAGFFKARDWNICYSEAISLFDTLFQEKKTQRFLFREKEQQFAHQINKRTIQATLPEDILVEYFPSESPVFSTKLQWKDLSFPIREGQVVGMLRVYKNDFLMKESPLVSIKEYEAEGMSFLYVLAGGAMVVLVILYGRQVLVQAVRTE